MQENQKPQHRMDVHILLLQSRVNTFKNNLQIISQKQNKTLKLEKQNKTLKLKKASSNLPSISTSN